MIKKVLIKKKNFSLIIKNSFYYIQYLNTHFYQKNMFKNILIFSLEKKIYNPERKINYNRNLS